MGADQYGDELADAMASPGYSRGIDAFGTLDTLPYSLDDRYRKVGEATAVPAFSARFVSGSALAATLETGTRMEGGAMRITGAVALTMRRRRPCSSVSARCVHAAWGDGQRRGFAPVDEVGQWYSLRFSTPAGQEWSFMRGFEAIEMHRQGRR